MRTHFSRLWPALTLLLMLYPGNKAVSATAEEVPAADAFAASVLIEGLENPWEMLWGPDGLLWVTERTGKRVTHVHPETGEKHVALVIEEAVAGSQQGVLGLALAPDFSESRAVYVAYTYQEGDAPRFRIARYTYQPDSGRLIDPSTVLEKLPAGDDHNAGRLVFGPDNKLYFAHGEQGHNQFANYCKPIEAQRLPTEKELTDKDWSAYVGKVLRLNTDGSIPEDNPVIKGVRSHIYTYGHRNPQGLVFVGDRLFSAEHGPSTDDEINLLAAGGNYGWPHVAGFRDDESYVYANYSAAPNCRELPWDANAAPKGVPVQKESEWLEDFVEPLKTLYTVPNGFNFHDPRCKDTPFLCWPTVAPSSITYYPKQGPVPGWGDSLLVSTLKSGALYRFALSSDGKSLRGDEEKLFHTPNRYRVVLVHPDGKTLFVATDNTGAALDEQGKPARRLRNPGSILKFTYTGR